jgi:AraC family transcriptional regulator
MNGQIDCLSKALHFIEEHLRDMVSVGDMADASGYSLFYFIRLFNQYVHHTPYDYLIRRRLTEATKEALSTNKRLIDIALDFQFQNAETFSRAFYRVHGVLPSQLRKQGCLDERQMLTSRTGRHLVHFQKSISLRPVIWTNAQCFIAGSLIFHDWRMESWQAFMSQCATLFPGRKEFQLSAMLPKETGIQKDGWLLGYEVKEVVDLPTDLLFQRIPEGRYAEFLHIGSLADISLSLDYIQQTWLSNSEEETDSLNVFYQFSIDEIEKIRISIKLK